MTFRNLESQNVFFCLKTDQISDPDTSFLLWPLTRKIFRYNISNYSICLKPSTTLLTDMNYSFLVCLLNFSVPTKTRLILMFIQNITYSYITWFKPVEGRIRLSLLFSVTLSKVTAPCRVAWQTCVVHPSPSSPPTPCHPPPLTVCVLSPYVDKALLCTLSLCCFRPTLIR